MSYLQNIHTHSIFCDGADTPEDMIISAIEKGFSSIGFSSHSYAWYSTYFASRKDLTEEYKDEVLSLKEKYKDKLDVYCGLEVDMYSAPDVSRLDYLIGAVHYLKLGDKYVCFDTTAEKTEKVIDEYFGGDGLAFAKEYYRQLALLPEYGSFDVIAHFDIVTKHLEKNLFFDMYSKEYTDAALGAAEALRGKIPLIEVNTGAIARGYRTSPYPALPLLRELCRMGFGAVITTDCHDRRFIDCGIREAENAMRECGFKEKYILGKDGFEAVSL